MSDYLWGQLSRAFRSTSSTAGRRAAKIMEAIVAIGSGAVHVGAPVPVRGMPGWVTPEIIRGGFATGKAAASGPLGEDEAALAVARGVPADRGHLFAWALSDDGLAYLDGLLDSGAYRLDLPEHGVLLTVAHLLRTDRAEQAAELVDTVRESASQLRFLPVELTEPEPDGVHVSTIRDAIDRLERKRPSVQVEAQREVLAVWQPFSDQLLELWWDTRDDAGVVGSSFADGWSARARGLSDAYDQLARQHTLTKKHARPGSTIQVLLGATRSMLDGSTDGASRARRSVTDVVSKRGAPGSESTRVLRDVQAAEVARPSHTVVAAEAAQHLASSADRFTAHPLDLIQGLPAANVPSLRNVVERAAHAPLPDLLDRGIISSAETLAALAPQAAAASVAARYDDPTGGTLAGDVSRAFAMRRSVLLLDYRKQVDVTALPWFAALESSIRTGAPNPSAQQARSLAGLALQHFPGTILPNPFLRVLDRLFTQAGMNVPITFELAADIFMGGFSDSFVKAGEIASDILGGTLYARYYGLGAVARTRDQFSTTARSRAGVTVGVRHLYSVARAGTIIEQGQILTTHNLATLVDAGVTIDWRQAADTAWTTVLRELLAAAGPRGLRHRKNAAYAWRQTVFFLSIADRHDTEEFLRAARHVREAGPVQEQAEEILAGLADVMTGRRSSRPPFLGWVHRPEQR